MTFGAILGNIGAGMALVKRNNGGNNGTNFRSNICGAG